MDTNQDGLNTAHITHGERDVLFFGFHFFKAVHFKNAPGRWQL